MDGGLNVILSTVLPSGKKWPSNENFFTFLIALDQPKNNSIKKVARRLNPNNKIYKKIKLPKNQNENNDNLPLMARKALIDI